MASQELQQVAIHVFGAHIAESKRNHARKLSPCRGDELAELEVVCDEAPSLGSSKVQYGRIGKPGKAALVEVDRVRALTPQERRRGRRDAHVEQESHS